MPHVRNFVVGKRSGIRAAAEPACKVTRQNTLKRQGKDSVRGLVTLRNSREEALLFAKIHAGKQLHNISVTVFSMVCKCRAETAQQTGHSAGAHEQRHRLAVAFAVVQVAPAVPYALFDEFHFLAGWPVGSKHILRNIADIQGFAQALQGSNEEEARDGIDGHGEGSAGHGADTHICDAGSDDGSGVLLGHIVTAEINDGSKQRRHGAHDLSEGQAAAVGEPVACDEDVGDEMFESEMRVVGLRSTQAQLRQHNLDEMRIKRLEDDKSAWHEEGSTAQANISHSAAAHMSQGPDSFTKDFMVPPSRFLNSASHLGSLTPPETTSAHPYVALNMAAARGDSARCRRSVSTARRWYGSTQPRRRVEEQHWRLTRERVQ